MIDFFKEKYEIKGKKFYSLIGNWRKQYNSLMTYDQMSFVMSVIEENKMNNVLEIGVFNGVSSMAMLTAGLSANKNFNLYSIDINKDEKFVGQAVKELCDDNQKKHYHLTTGQTVFNIEKIIPKDIKFDLVFIDAGHSHPLPLFDLIYSIPYMHDNTIILLHDIVNYMRPNAWGESFIFESWRAKKYRVYDYDHKKFSNMGVIKLHENKKELMKNINLISKIKFRANPWAINIYYDINNIKDYKYTNYGLQFSIEDINNIKKYVSKFYSKRFAKQLYNNLTNNYENYMSNCYLYMHETRFYNYLFENDNTNINNIKNLQVSREELLNELNKIKFDYAILNNKFNSLINNLAWWIPVRKFRDNFRNKFKTAEQSRAEQSRAVMFEYAYRKTA